MTYLSKEIVAAAKRHARAEFPHESCGLVVGDAYIPCRNVATDTLVNFEIDPAEYARHLKTGLLRAVLHSHPNGPLFPSDSDMRSQIASDKVWGIIALDDERAADPVLWGGDLEIPHVIGRQFIHGVTDCYALLRDVFRLGDKRLKEQDIEGWPFPPITLPDFARRDAWWVGEDDFYEVEPQKLGFRIISNADVRPGDVMLMKLRSSKLNHAAMLIGNSLLVHHLPMRLSRREPANLWARQADRWIRYEGEFDA